jgi:hypothetical protein
MTAAIDAMAGRGAAGLSTVSAKACSDVLDVDGLSATLITIGGGELIWHSGELAARLDELHLTLGQGPGVTAAATGELVSHADLSAVSTAARWPVFAAAAVDLGVRAVLAVPMRVGAIRLGVLVAHRAAAATWSRQTIADALALTDAAAGALLRPTGGGAPGPQWLRDHPSSYRAEVHQATGMLIVQLRIGAEEALVRLRAYAYVNGRTLTEVARDVVARRLHFDREKY